MEIFFFSTIGNNNGITLRRTIRHLPAGPEKLRRTMYVQFDIIDDEFSRHVRCHRGVLSSGIRKMNYPDRCKREKKKGTENLIR